jgi:hypothetical protein
MVHLGHTRVADQGIGDGPHYAHGHWVLSLGASIDWIRPSTYYLDREHRRTICYDMGGPSKDFLFASRRGLFPRVGRRTRAISSKQRHNTTTVSSANNTRHS